MSDWILRHSAQIIGVLLAFTIVVSGFTVWLVLEDINQDQKLIGVESVGPCRAAFKKGGIPAVRKDMECSQQSDLLFVNFCYRHPGVPACRVALKEVVHGGGNQPSGQPSPSPGGRTPVEPTTPTPAPTPSPAPVSPGNSQICTPGVSPVLPAVCL